MKRTILIAACAASLAWASGAQASDPVSAARQAAETRARAGCLHLKALYNFRGFDNDAGPNECSEGELRLYTHIETLDPARLLATEPTAAGKSGSTAGPKSDAWADCAAAKAQYAHLGFEEGDTEDPGYDARACSETEMLLYRQHLQASAAEPAAPPRREPPAGWPPGVRKRILPP